MISSFLRTAGCPGQGLCRLSCYKNYWWYQSIQPGNSSKLPFKSVITYLIMWSLRFEIHRFPCQKVRMALTWNYPVLVTRVIRKQSSSETLNSWEMNRCEYSFSDECSSSQWWSILYLMVILLGALHGSFDYPMSLVVFITYGLVWSWRVGPLHYVDYPVSVMVGLSFFKYSDQVES